MRTFVIAHTITDPLVVMRTKHPRRYTVLHSVIKQLLTFFEDTFMIIRSRLKEVSVVIGTIALVLLNRPRWTKKKIVVSPDNSEKLQKHIDRKRKPSVTVPKKKVKISIQESHGRKSLNESFVNKRFLSNRRLKRNINWY